MTEKRKSLYELTQDEIDLEAAFAESESEEDAQALVDTQMQSDEKIVRMMRIVEEKEFFAATCKAAYEATKEIIERRKQDAKIAENEVERIKARIIKHMEMKGIDEKVAAHYRLRVQTNPMSLRVRKLIDIDTWQDDWYTVDYKPEKKIIKKYIDETGHIPEGCTPIYTKKLIINTEKKSEESNEPTSEA